MKAKRIFVPLACLSVLASLGVWCWPRDAEYYFNRGQERFDYQDEDGNGDLRGALADFNRVIRRKPKFAAAYLYRGRVKEAEGDQDGALGEYNRAVELDPTDARNYTCRAWFWEHGGDLAGAIADLDRAIELSPRAGDLFERRARLKSKQGNVSGMVADRERASEVFPPPSADQLRLADSLTAGRKPARVLPRLIHWYDRALAENPDFCQGYLHRGVLKYLANNPSGALADFRRCAEFPEVRLRDDAAIHIWLVRVRQGETNEASRELSAYFESRTNGSPHDWEVQIEKFLVGQTGVTDLSAAIGPANVEWERSEFWFYTGMKQLLAGDNVKAAEDFRKARSTETRPYAVAISTQIELSRLGP